MTRKSRFTDLQSILLSTAAQRTDRSLFPAPQSIAGKTDLVIKAAVGLVARALVDETVTTDALQVWREADDVSFSLHINDAGLAAIGVGETDAAAERGDMVEPADQGAPLPKTESKIAAVTGLLRRPEGAILAELIDHTGWLPHTTRAALTGLRKKGHQIAKIKRGDDTCYSIGEA